MDDDNDPFNLQSDEEVICELLDENEDSAIPRNTEQFDPDFDSSNAGLPSYGSELRTGES